MERFEALLFQGTLTALRSLSLDTLIRHLDALIEMNAPDDIAAFPIKALEAVIAEKQTQRAMN